MNRANPGSSLAEDIARRTLLQSLTVRPVLDESGAETGIYEVPAGGRRYRALELLVKQKRLARTAPVPCIIRTGDIAEEGQPRRERAAGAASSARPARGRPISCARACARASTSGSARWPT